MISEHLDKNNLHHAYLIEGVRDEVVPEILIFLKDIGVNASANNPDFVHVSMDSFKVDDARNFKSLGSEKGFSFSKKIFIISANQILLEAQNSLLKMFEEPIENTHFFIVVPDVSALIKTFVSRFYLINTKGELKKEITDAEKFIKMPVRSRLDFVKELLAKEDEEDEEGNEIVQLDSNRARAISFLNAIESVVHEKMLKTGFDIKFFEQIFKVRKFLRMPGSSTKSLMESVALVIPNFEN